MRTELLAFKRVVFAIQYSQNNVRMYRQLQALTAPLVNGACTAVA
jgi:hypothetical protein